MKQRHKYIRHWDDERNIGNSLIVTLILGRRYDTTDIEHVRGFDTVKEAMEAVRESVPCHCNECHASQSLNRVMSGLSFPVKRR